mgnify:CR=1 FL=1
MLSRIVIALGVGDDDNRDQVLKNCADAELILSHCAHSQTTNDTSDRNSDQTSQNTGTQVRFI